MTTAPAVRDLTLSAINLAKGKVYEEATKCLLEALNVVKQRSDVRVPLTSIPTASSSDSQPAASIETESFDYDDDDLGQSPDSSFAFYNRCFTYEGMDDMSTGCIEITSATLIFNTAAIYHATALKTYKVDTFKRAIKLYHLLINNIETMGNQEDPGLLHIKLATINNMGHIFSILMDRRNMVHCGRCLLSNLQYLDWKSTCAEDADFFSSCMIFLSCPGALRTSPAA